MPLEAYIMKNTFMIIALTAHLLGRMSLFQFLPVSSAYNAHTCLQLALNQHTERNIMAKEHRVIRGMTHHFIVKVKGWWLLATHMYKHMQDSLNHLHTRAVVILQSWLNPSLSSRTPEWRCSC